MTTSSIPVRVLVVGAGAFGREHIDRLAGRSDVSLAGVADTDPAALELVKSRHDVLNCLTDYLRLIDDVDADAVIIATPAGSHVEICLRALGRNLCVLLEKPVAPSAATAAPLVSSARRSSGFVLPGHVLRFSHDHARLIEIVRSGRIGEAVYVNSRRYRDDSHAVRYPDTDPVLMTLIHDVDLALWVTNSDFRSVLARRAGDGGYRSMTAVSATTANGVACDLRTAWTFADGELPPERSGGGRRPRQRRVGRRTDLACLCRGTLRRISCEGGRSFAERTRSFSGLRPRPVADAGARSASGGRWIEARRRGHGVSSSIERSSCPYEVRSPRYPPVRGCRGPGWRRLGGNFQETSDCPRFAAAPRRPFGDDLPSPLKTASSATAATGGEQWHRSTSSTCASHTAASRSSMGCRSPSPTANS